MENSTISIKERFLTHNIPYDSIDPELIETIDLLNFKHHLWTKYSCSGHGSMDKFYIIFHEKEDCGAIEVMAEHILNKMSLKNLYYIKFDYFIRGIEERSTERTVYKNWVLRATRKMTHEKRLEVIDEINNILRKI